MISFLLVALLSSTKAYPATLVDCYDGDTCTFVLDLSLGVQKTEDIRVCDVDAPEMTGSTKPAGIKSRDETLGILRGAERVVVQVPQKSRCKDSNRCEQRSFTRLLGWVIVDGKVLGELLLKSGHVRPAEKTCGKP